MIKIIAILSGLVISCATLAQTPTGFPWQPGQVLNSTSLNTAFSARATFLSGPLTLNSILLGNGSGDIATLSSFGTSGQVLTSNGIGLAPSFTNNSYNASAVNIIGGSINGTALGNASPNTGAFSTLSISGAVSGNGINNLFAAPPALGATTPNAAHFTTVSTTSPIPISSGGTGNTTGAAAVNANLTGPITSVGNATSIASQTGTGSKIVVDTSPTLIAPNLGTPSALIGTNITGTAASLNIGGNATTATTATNLSGGTVSATAITSSSGAITPAYPAGIVGNATGSAVTSGRIGEHIANNATSSALVSSAQTIVTSVNLTAGTWLVYGYMSFIPAGSTAVNNEFGGFSTSASLSEYISSLPGAPGFQSQVALITTYFLIGSSTTVNCITEMVFSVSTATAFCAMHAIRIG